ncbi:MAG: mechanosensitive ion channel protein MscS [Gemmatimonadales bacterium]|nr:MAG: mechanosensitive ion channel protein MscS [Gemmatimonadales bacterium]
MRSIAPLPVLAALAVILSAAAAPHSTATAPDLRPAHAPTSGLALGDTPSEQAPPAQTPPDTLTPPAQDTVERFDPAPGTADLQRSIQELLAIYRRIDGLREVRITVEDRILELSGTALSMDDRLRAGELAERIPNIVWVDNRIVVETDLRKRLAPVVERLGEKADRALRFIPSLLVGLILIGGSFTVAYYAGRWIFPVRKGEAGPFHRNLLRQCLRAVIGLTGILLALELMDATALVGAVLGAAGVFGIAVGFAFRDIVENYLSGVLLSLRQPFSPNDHVELGGHEGRIVRLTGRETILMTLDGNHVRVPNTMVFKSVMTNFTRNPRRRFVVDVGIAPEEPVQAALDAGRDAIIRLPGVLESPAVSARIREFGDSTVEVRFSGWVDQTVADFVKVRSQALKAVKERFEADGIQTPPPEYGVRILSDPEPGEASPAPTTPPAPATPMRDPAPADIAPDTTIEEEIAREIRDSDEEDLLQR